MGLLDKLFKKKEEAKPEEPKKEDRRITARKTKDDDHLYTTVIRYDKTGLMILISYTSEYFYSIIEFMSMCSLACIGMRAETSSYEEITDDIDENGERVVHHFDHDRYYLLISATEEYYQNLFHSASNLANEVLEAVTQEIYDRCLGLVYEEFCIDGILNKSSFIHFNMESGVYDECGSYQYTTSEGVEFTIDYMLASEVMKKLPDVYLNRDILDLLLLNESCSEYNDHHSLDDILYMFRHDTISYDDIQMYDKAFSEMLGTTIIYYTDYADLADPRYLWNEDDTNENVSGEMASFEIDSMFKEKYEKFSAVSDKDIFYKDIDERIGPNEESENMRKVDILQDSDE